MSVCRKTWKVCLKVIAGLKMHSISNDEKEFESVETLLPYNEKTPYFWYLHHAISDCKVNSLWWYLKISAGGLIRQEIWYDIV